MTAVILGPKVLSELVFKAVQYRKRSGYADCQQVRSIDRNLFFSKLKLLILTETMMTTVEEVNSDKTKVSDEFIFRSVLLDCFTAELDG